MRVLALDGNQAGSDSVQNRRKAGPLQIPDPKHPSSQIREDRTGGIRYLFMGTPY